MREPTREEYEQMDAWNFFFFTGSLFAKGYNQGPYYVNGFDIELTKRVYPSTTAPGKHHKRVQIRYLYLGNPAFKNRTERGHEGYCRVESLIKALRKFARAINYNNYLKRNGLERPKKYDY
jgi:hypothetical protein